ncbi:MAG TPA: hypothetical protein VKS81_05310 [Bacteroidota bacterium]|nr:hypothetical protein [Bacteroidota bacterium]
MKLSTCLLLFVTLALSSVRVAAQIDSTLLRSAPTDSVRRSLNMDAVFNRSLMAVGKLPISIGGYMEGNWENLGTAGVSDGNQFQFRRVSVFLSSTISPRIKFMSEIEFENGAEDIEVEFAALDFEFDPLLNLRGGMIINPIGGFNQNHDGPKWEFVDRPIAMTEMLPDTWSNAGFGLYGKKYTDQGMLGYEIYISGGFDDSIIENSEGKTFLPAATNNPDRFEESANGKPLITGKVAAGNDILGEIGLSYMGGVYNTYQDEGVIIDAKRRVDVLDIDYNTTLPKIDTRLIGEWAWIFVDVPPTYSEQFGTEQRGGFLDIVQPLLKGDVFGWSNAVVNVACRLEYVDWNVGNFRETGGNIADDLWSIMPAISFRPNAESVIRLNYRFQEQRDILGNPAVTTAGLIFGISTYF